MPLLVSLVDLYLIVVLVAVILSLLQVDRRNPVAAIVRGLTEPLLEPIRSALPPRGRWDFSPMVLWILLRLVRGLLF